MSSRVSTVATTNAICAAWTAQTRRRHRRRQPPVQRPSRQHPSASAPSLVHPVGCRRAFERRSISLGKRTWALWPLADVAHRSPSPAEFGIVRRRSQLSPWPPVRRSRLCCGGGPRRRRLDPDRVRTVRDHPRNLTHAIDDAGRISGPDHQLYLCDVPGGIDDGHHILTLSSVFLKFAPFTARLRVPRNQSLGKRRDCWLSQRCCDYSQSANRRAPPHLQQNFGLANQYQPQRVMLLQLVAGGHVLLYVTGTERWFLMPWVLIGLVWI